MQHIIKLTSIYLLLCLFACQNEANSTVEKLPEKLNDNQLEWTINGKAYKNPQVQAHLFQRENYYQLDISSMNGNAGLLLILVTDNKKLIGNYSLKQQDKNGIPFSKTSIKMNEIENNLLNVYISEDCKPIDGFIEIEAYDSVHQTISGHFQANLCTNGRFGKLDKRDIKKGRFEKIALKTVLPN